jgi:hypothetical protein
VSHIGGTLQVIFSTQILTPFFLFPLPQRAIQGRAKLARKQSLLNESTDEALSQSLQALKEAFPRSSLPKGQPLDLFFTPSTSGNGLDLTMEEDGKVLGKVESPRGHAESQFSVARQLMLAYLADKDEISKPVSICGLCDILCLLALVLN